MPQAEAVMHEASAEVEDLLQRSTKRSKESHDAPDPPKEDQGMASGSPREGIRSYHDTVRGDNSKDQSSQDEDDDEGNTSNDDLIEEGDGYHGLEWG